MASRVAWVSCEAAGVGEGGAGGEMVRAKGGEGAGGGSVGKWERAEVRERVGEEGSSGEGIWVGAAGSGDEAVRSTRDPGWESDDEGSMA